MLFARPALFCFGVLSAGVAIAGPVGLYDGSATPTAEGWTRNAGAAGTELVGAGTTQFSTVNNNDGGRTSQLSTYAYATGATNYIASIRLQVIASSYNLLDAGLTFSAFGSTGGFIQNDRYNNLMIDRGTVLWGDEGASSAVGNTTGFHDYAIRYLNGTLDVYFDKSIADIQAGTATSILTRTTGPRNANVGTVVFGDATNDVDFNSTYAVDSVDFVNLDATDPVTVPEPASSALAALGLGAAGWFGRRRPRPA